MNEAPLSVIRHPKTFCHAVSVLCLAVVAPALATAAQAAPTPATSAAPPALATPAASTAPPASAPDSERNLAANVQSWLYPTNSPPPAAAIKPTTPPALDTVTPIHLPGSAASYSEAQLQDLFSAPDWFPESHSAMPDIVAKGRKPAVYACGFCHTPGGQGRPENASLAGLPVAYIIQQVADFKTGARRSASPDSYLPTDLMIEVSKHADDAEVATAAEYFSQQRPMTRVRVVERDRVPRSKIVGYVYAAVPGAGEEPIGNRLLEFSPDPERHEKRDDKMQYIAYVPRGSVARGRLIASTGKDGPAVACVSCHGNRLQGTGVIPRIAGRSPTYLLRQLVAFQTGARSGAGGQPMKAVALTLQITDMIDVAAYAASLQP